MNLLVPFNNCHVIYKHSLFQAEASLCINKLDVIEDIAFVVESSNAEYQSCANAIAQKVIGQKLDQIDFSQYSRVQELAILEILSLAIEKFRGENNLPYLLKENLNASQIVCRCTGTDENELNKIVEENYADLAQVLKKTMIGQVCGSCIGDIKNACQASEHWATLLYGKSPAYWQEVIASELGQMNKSLPEVYSKVHFEFINFKKGLLKVRCSGERSGLTRPEIQSVVRHHLQGKLQIPLELSIVF